MLWAAGRREFVGFLVAALTYIGLRIAAFLPASTATLGDTDSYLPVAAAPVFNFRFLAGDRPWVVPLLYKLDSDSASAAAQLGISIACWLALAAVVAWCVREKRLRPVAFGL